MNELIALKYVSYGTRKPISTASTSPSAISMGGNHNGSFNIRCSQKPAM